MYISSFYAPDGRVVYTDPRPTVERAFDLAHLDASVEYGPDLPCLYPHPLDPNGLPLYVRPDGTGALIQVEPFPLFSVSVYDPIMQTGYAIPV